MEYMNTKYELSETSAVWLFSTNATLLLRLSSKTIVVSLFALILGLLVIGVLALTVGMHVSMIPFSCLAVAGFLVFNYQQEVEIDLEQKMILRKDQLCKVAFHTVFFSWDGNCYFNYIAQYDANKNISLVTFWARSSEMRNSRKIIQFSNPELFFEFQRLFNEKYPEHQILETAFSFEHLR